MAAVVWEVLKVVTACHAAGVCHGDIKPANFLLARKLPRPLHMVPAGARPDDGPWLVAIDFGCAQLAPPTKQLTRRTGTPVYMVSPCESLSDRFARSQCLRPPSRAACSASMRLIYQTRSSRGTYNADGMHKPVRAAPLRLCLIPLHFPCPRRQRSTSASTHGPRTCGASA